MKFLSSITLTILVSTISYAQTTMCFKENHNSMATIESTVLNGGECKSTHTINDMKEKGWNVDDIKISTTNQGKYNFIYILKKGSINSTLSESDLEARILARLEQKKIQEIKEKEIQTKLQNKIMGKKIYTNKCQSCHGAKGEISAYNVAIPLKDMTIEDIKFAISRYSNDHDFGKGYNIIMRPIAANITSNKLTKIKDYLDSINK